MRRHSSFAFCSVKSASVFSLWLSLSLARSRKQGSAALCFALFQRHCREFSALCSGSNAREIGNPQERLHAPPKSLVVRRITFSKQCSRAKKRLSRPHKSICSEFQESENYAISNVGPVFLTVWHSTAYSLAPKARLVEFFKSFFFLRWRARARARVRLDTRGREKITRWKPKTSASQGLTKIPIEP